MRLRSLDLLMAVVVSAMNVLWALLPEHMPIVGIVLALPLVFVFPGYTLTEAMFHRRGARLKGSYHLLLSLALSLAIDILSGFVLNLLPAGLNELSWALWLSLMTVVFAVISWLLRRRGWGEGRNGARTRGRRPHRRTRLHPAVRGTSSSVSNVLSRPWGNVLQVMVLALALVVAVFAFGYAASSLAEQPHAGFTQLWLLPEVGAGNGCTVRMGVRSFEAGQVRYRVVMRMNGVRVGTWAVVALATQQEWDQVVSLRPMSPGRMFVEVRLYKLDMPKTVYRDVHLTWRVLAGGKMLECVMV